MWPLPISLELNPMRRSICYCEPNSALAGELNTWQFVFTPAVKLPKKTKLKFDLGSDGRDIDWETPSANLRKGSNVIYAKMGKGKPITATEVENPKSYVPQFEFTLTDDLPAGEEFTIFMGSPKMTKGSMVKDGNGAQMMTQRRRLFKLYTDPSGKGKYNGDPEVFSMDIRGNELANIRVVTPSIVGRNKRFDVAARFEDQFGNLTSLAPEDTMIELSYENLRENLKWRLFVPETGFLALPNLYFNEPGNYTIQLLNTKTGETFYSAPIKCFPEIDKAIFWGTLHGESERIDSTENIDGCVRYFRDEKAFNFYGVSPFESTEETPNDLWKQIVQTVNEYDDSERFTGFVGFQWQGVDKKEGLRTIVYAKDQKQILRKKDAKSNCLSKIYKSSNPKELISIPCFTMGKGMCYDFKSFDPQFERVVEIYNAWGSSECTAKEGNPFPIKSIGSKGVKETPEGSIQEALKNNCRFGFVAGGLDDRGAYAELYESDQEQYSPGQTAIISTDHNRSGLAAALYNRSCYATTGERIIVGFTLAGQPMGSELNAADKKGLMINRHIAGYVSGTTDLKSVEIICNGKTLKKFKPESYAFDFEYDDLTPLEKNVIKPKGKASPFAYYYLRATQKDGHMAWSSPIWVDVNKEQA